eukprot:373246-Rhodomonas_salina.1
MPTDITPKDFFSASCARTAGTGPLWLCHSAPLPVPEFASAYRRRRCSVISGARKIGVCGGATQSEPLHRKIEKRAFHERVCTAAGQRSVIPVVGATQATITRWMLQNRVRGGHCYTGSTWQPLHWT